MSFDENHSEWMRIKQFLAYVAKETGERLGWRYLNIHAADQDIKIPFTTSPHDGNSTLHKESTYFSKIFHSDGWYRNDEMGTHLVSFGNGANYIPHWYPSIAGTLFVVIGEARTILVPPRNTRKKHRDKREQRPEDILMQSRYGSGVLLFGLCDGTIAVSDEHPFYPKTLELLETQLEHYRRKVDYTIPGVIVPHGKNMLTIEEYHYHRNFVPILAEHIVTQIICATEGLALQPEPLLRFVTPTQH